MKVVPVVVSALTAVALLHVEAARARGLPQEAATCSAIDDDSARLACYDRYNPPRKAGAQVGRGAAPSPRASSAATQPAREAATSPPASNAATQAAQPASADASGQEFGLTGKLLRQKRTNEGKPEAPQKMVARVAAVSKRTYGELLLQLDNGQSWVQTETRAGLVINPGDTVTIRQGALGGYLLSAPSGMSTRVRRLQ